LRSRNNRGVAATIIWAYSAPLRYQAPPSEVRCRPSVTIWAIDNGVSPTRESPRTDIALQTGIQQACALRESHNTIRTTFAARIFRSPPLRTPMLGRPTSIVLETDRVIFVRPALFAPVFVTPWRCPRHAYRERNRLSY